MLAWLVGSSIGRYVAVGGLLLVVVGMAARYLYALGRDHERQQQAAERAMAAASSLAKRLAVERQISDLPIAQRREQLRRYVDQL